MLVADSISFAGRHTSLVDPTSLRVRRGEVLLVVAEPQLSRTALSLLLSGRMKPGAGSIRWKGSTGLAKLRAGSALVDSPEINAPEQHLKIRDLVAEDLSLVPEPIWRKRGIDTWLETHGFAPYADDWIDSVDPLVRLEIMARLSEEYRQVQLAVFDSPDRHGIQDASWLELLETLAGTRRRLAVVAVVSRVPECWAGAVAHLGEDQPTDFFGPPSPAGLLDGPDSDLVPALSVPPPECPDAVDQSAAAGPTATPNEAPGDSGSESPASPRPFDPAEDNSATDPGPTAANQLAPDDTTEYKDLT